MVSKLSLKSLVEQWQVWSGEVEAEYVKAAIKLANHVSTNALEGTSDSNEVYRVEFDCAMVKRNRMLGALAKKTLSSLDDSVTKTVSFLQYYEGLISAVECCDELAFQALKQ